MENPKQKIQLHPKAKEISLKHKFTINKIFNRSVLGQLAIDYFSLILIDSVNTATIYSNCPSLEYNLIEHELWQYDGISMSDNLKTDQLVFWDELYPDNLQSEFKSIKEDKYGFNFGFYIMKKINNLFVIYSFATKSDLQRDNFRNSKDNLEKVGDWFFNELQAVHSLYVPQQIKERSKPKRSSFLKLIIDNTNVFK